MVGSVMNDRFAVSWAPSFDSEYLRETLPKPGEATAQRLTKRRLNAPAASLP
jgi:hypothetical protein